MPAEVAWSDAIHRWSCGTLQFAQHLSVEELGVIKLQVHTKQLALSSACKLMRPMLFLRGRWRTSLSWQHLYFSGHLLQVNLPWEAFWLAIPLFSSDFCAGSLRETDECVWRLLLLRSIWENRWGEKRMCGALWGSVVGRSHDHYLAVGRCLSQDGSKFLVWLLQLLRLDFAGLLSAPFTRITVYPRASAFC